MLLVCDKHMKEALKLVEMPQIQKVQTGQTCSFCNVETSLLMNMVNQPNPVKKKPCGKCVKCSCLIAN
ncbi:hypothetical protein COE53_17605 [Bacillus sp. AFS029533]|uniref:Uncharacterized protein n=1 Tax=Gottfriedia luciferensis TaxID=178774 RepID=A0ABX2ZRV3_9BACI|nr:hypothetical protein BED47_19685 [Gottfriedia luciferensis]PGZ90608.1 hypothetical protein COE53_17605 [Bacillus sp. AFS029533]SFD50660.1 hypothetical protein SAMN02799633_04010 [Bacillus sp. UNCCL81]